MMASQPATASLNLNPWDELMGLLILEPIGRELGINIFRGISSAILALQVLCSSITLNDKKDLEESAQADAQKVP